MKKWFAALMMLGFLMVPARPMFFNPPMFMPKPVGGAYSGPGDLVAGAKFWYGLRAYSNALANAGASTTKVIDVRGVTTSGVCTIFLKGTGTGGLDLTTAGAGGLGNQCLLGATTFCTSTNTNCAISKFYDQTVGNQCGPSGPGFTCDATQPTAANQPLLAFSVVGGNAAMNCASASSQVVQSANVYVSSVFLYTISTVSEFTGSGQGGIFSAGSGIPQVGSGLVAANYFMYAGVTVFEAAAAASVFHAAQSVFLNTASSVFYIDGTSNTGNAGTSSNFWGSGGTKNILLCADDTSFWQGYFGEAGYWETTFSAGQQSSMNSNQHSFWGF